MFFTQQGQCYWLKVHEIPQAARAARGKPMVSCIAIKPDERIAALVPVREFSDDQFLLFATKNGVVKKTVLSEFGNPRSVGIRAINIEKGDELIDVQVTDGKNDIVLATRHGMSIRFHEKDVRDMGRTGAGVQGSALEKRARVIDMVVVRRKSTVLTVTEKGMGKRSELDEYRVQHRGGRGIITLKRADKTGNIVALKEVLPDDELMMITKKGIMIRVPVEGIRISGRNTQGVKVMNLESLQLIGAFKLRGAYNAIRRLPDPARKRGVITYSSGNHGQALAYAAQLVGVRAVVVMPETAPAVKVAGVKKWGGEVVLAGRTSDDRQRRAEAIAAREGLAIVPPFDHPDIVAGQATVGLEIAEQLADVRTVVVPVGGGGLIAGVVTGLAAAGSRATVWGIEPAGAPKLKRSLEAGRPVRLERTTSIADGLITPHVGGD